VADPTIPFVFFNSVFDDAGVTLSASSEQAAFPVSNVTDWRMGTPYRWKSDVLTDDQEINFDAGAGNTTLPDTFAIAGHNFGTIGATVTLQSDTDDIDPYTTVRGPVTVSDDLPLILTNSSSTPTRYWRLRILKDGGGSFASKPEIGIYVLGDRLEFTGAGVEPGLDPWGVESVVEDSRNENGSPIGVNVKYRRKMFHFDYSTAGIADSDFFNPASGLGFDDDFKPHAIDAGKPFFFNWNLSAQADENYLCWVRDIRMPFVGSTARRAFQAQFEGYRETA